jgi:dTDP-4-dehydrorhamnose 3,5-epimerase
VKFLGTGIPGVVLVEPDVHADDRGFFLESYHARKYRDGGIDVEFVQDNHSRSRRGTLRGLHMQLAHPQGKLVRALTGSVFDVCVDVRIGSPTFGRHVTATLDDVAHRQIYVPPGFAHGFAVTSDEAEIEYKCTDFYAPGDELSILWNDPEIGIAWPIHEPILSDRDRAGSRLADVLDRLPRLVER